MDFERFTQNPCSFYENQKDGKDSFGILIRHSCRGIAKWPVLDAQIFL